MPEQQQRYEIALPAQWHITPSGAYIDYYVILPDGTHARKVTRCNRAVKRAGSRAAAVRFLKGRCAAINARLLAPGGEEPPRRTEARKEAALRPLLRDAAVRYLREKGTFLRKSTMLTYTTLARKITSLTPPGTALADFGSTEAADFLARAAEEGRLSARSYNNCLKQARAMWQWFAERGLTERNPFAAIRPRRTGRKRRTVISPEDCRRMLEWADARLPYLSLVMLLIHSSLVRPKEIRLLRVEDVDLVRHTVRVRQEVAKNGRERFAALTPQAEEYVRRTLEMGGRPSDYLVTPAGRPGAEPSAEKRFLKDWYRMKAELRLPDAYQLYSLRDTGITALIKKGVDDITVMRHADHSSLKMTSLYARHEEISVTGDIYASGLEM